jgi:dihydropteroate synthase
VDVKLQVPERKNTLNFNGKLVTLHKPVVMGIINATPDSFYTHSRKQHISEALDMAASMVNDGAAILDVGGYSSRPGATPVTEQEETDRVLPVIEALHSAFPDVPLSIDTFRANVARHAVNAGASAVNDISSGDDDENMIPTVAELEIPYFIMHKQGVPQTMQQNPTYDNVVLDVMSYFSDKLEKLRKAGISDCVIDPGFGFGKTLEHNYTLLRSLSDFGIFGLPVMAGVSRKSMIQKIIHATAEKSLNGSTVLHTIALLNGANILRVHDVKEAMECINLVEALNGKIT